jgi:ADP-ribosyl-[dinitrogen reductase] hydrolase
MLVRLIDRYLGCLLGLAAGDALGTTCEFERPGSFTPLTNIVGGGPFELTAGQWTDDTSMALCLAESLIETGKFDPVDQMQRYVAWRRTGHLSSNGVCFDIGNTVRNALTKFEQTGEPFCGDTDPKTAGNGSLMRLAAVPMFYAQDAAVAIAMSAESSKTTHGATAAVDACRFYAGLIVGAFGGAAKDELLSPHYCPISGLWTREPLDPEIGAIADGSYKTKTPPEIVGSGYVVKSLEAALWAFYTTDDFESGCLRAANLGNDADTTAAIYGQLAGAFYGIEAMPPSWVAKLAKRELIESMAQKLYEMSR